MAQRDGRESVQRGGVVVSRARPVDVEPRAALRALSGPRVAWTAPDEPDVVGCQAAAMLTADGPERFDVIAGTAEDLFRGHDFALSTAVSGARPADPSVARPRLLGGFAFHDDHASRPPWKGFPGAQFVLPRIQVVSAESTTWLTATTHGRDASEEAAESALDQAEARLEEAGPARTPPPGILGTERTPERTGWRRQVETALERIASGRLEKVVLAQTLTARLDGPFRLAETLARLDRTYPDCYRFGVDPGMGAAFFGATPECLIRRWDTRVETEALAGSIGRGGTAAEDDRLARELRDSGKVQHEHRLVADAIGDQLSPYARRLEVGDQGIRKLPNVQHLETPIAADLDEPRHVLTLVQALHPTPAVGGIPPEAAWETIRETERFDRGWYAAPVGWFDADGNGTFAVGIRSGVATESAATLFAGNGIVADSDPEAEWDELQLKYRPILDQLR